jgi:hypothetical protein
MQAHGQEKKYTENDPEQQASPEEPDNGNQYNILGYPEPGRLRMFGEGDFEFSFYDFIEWHC